MRNLWSEELWLASEKEHKTEKRRDDLFEEREILHGTALVQLTHTNPG